MDRIEKVIRFYEDPIQDKKSRLAVWEEGKSIGSAVTPSAMYVDYRSRIVGVLDDLVKSVPCKRILSLGCGNAFIEMDLKNLGHDILVTDISPQALDFAKAKGLEVAYLDVTQSIPKTHGSFGLVFLEGVIGHLFDESGSIDYLLKFLIFVDILFSVFPMSPPTKGLFLISVISLSLTYTEQHMTRHQ